MKLVWFLISLLIFEIFHAQNISDSEYYKIKKKYEDYPENDSRAMPLVHDYIKLSKSKKNNNQLSQAYKDAVFYSSSEVQKLKYADSTISSALLTDNKNLISDSYLGKGIIYYFNYKKYKLALEEYLKAYDYSMNSDDEYLKNEISYHIGVLKSYLGYYDSALLHFQKTSLFFYEGTKDNLHPNIIFNNKKGYYNSLHRMIVCHRNIHNYKAVDSLINLGLAQTKDQRDYKQEFGYFLKEKGIESLRKKEYDKALVSLQKSVQPLSQIKDFSWTTVNYFYIGKTYLAKNNPKKAIVYFKKVDSVFNRHQFILPEIRANYEILINLYRQNNDNVNELYYTKQLLKADGIISADFSYLSLTIHKEFDTKALEKEKLRLEHTNSIGFLMMIFLIYFAFTLIIILIIKYKKEKKTTLNYRILEEKILSRLYFESQSKYEYQEKEEDKCSLNDDLVKTILQKLKQFEDNCEFTESKLTINRLARRLNTNSNYLSQIINEFKGMNFNRYLSDLRINYITKKLYTEKIYLTYKVETLADECGIASRTNFSNLFQEINGMRPAEFIKKRQKNLENECQN